MLLGDLLTAIQEEIPLKVIVFNNGTLGFVELEMKIEGLLNAFTDLQNPDFGKLAEVMGFRGWTVDHNEKLEPALLEFLPYSGPALLDVRVNRTELVMPPHIEPGVVFGAALYGAKAVLSGRAKDLVNLVETNFLK
jgi:pyruvate dehydrogenase (quinone)